MPTPLEHGSTAVRTLPARVMALLALGSLAALHGTAARAEWDLAAAAGLSYDNNLTRAQDGVDKRAAGAVNANVTAARFIPFSGSDSVLFALDGRAEAFSRYSGLSNLVVGGSASYRHKFGLGAEAPWMSMSLRVSYDDYREDLRTSTRLHARAEAGQRFGAQFDASAGVYYERRYDNHGESIVPGVSGHVFDLAGQGVDARAGYAATNEWYLDAKAGVRRGDVESTSQRSLPISLASSAITDDPVWGDPNLYAYRLRGTTYTGALTASYAVNDQSSLDISYEYGLTRAAQGLEYITNAVFVTFTHRY